MCLAQWESVFKVDCDKVASLFDDPNMTYGNDKNGSCQ
ncbi:hypothetical protein J2X05_001439 [Cellvibrio fibrivorans]|jgi:hypothetical protein|uniref:Uncharacterized protein n=1 Tax=Cellvibrio fibrivorans TaxID=126350 RepID=A0ABU1UW67_9GAMM|nr:hypothetical protein [Cellvibrio fibrivorans]